MKCCQAEGIEELFDAAIAAGDLERYRKKGPDRSTRILINALKAEGVNNLSLLDIGGGVGAVQYELLKAGLKEATSVDVSSSYLKSAREETEHQGFSDRIQHHLGDFVEIAGEIADADIVTLDRVICCYDDVENLVERSTQRSRKYYGVIYPPDHWWMKAITWFENLYYRYKRIQFRSYVHETQKVDGMIRSAGLERCFTKETMLWHIHLYKRVRPADQLEH